MKKISLLFLLLSLSSLSFAQSDTLKENKNNPKYKWGCAVAINSIHGQVAFFQSSLGASGNQFMDADGNIISAGNKRDKSFSLSVIPKYFINDNFLLRFEFGFTNLEMSSNYDAKYFSTHQISNYTLKSNIFKYAPSLQWTAIKKKWIDLFCGMSGSYIKYNSLKYTNHAEFKALPEDTLKSWGTTNTSVPGGFAIGIGGFSGFNIYLLKRFSLGLEFSSALLYYKTGGEIISENTGQVLPNPVSTEVDRHATSYRGVRATRIVSSFNIFYWF